MMERLYYFPSRVRAIRSLAMEMHLHLKEDEIALGASGAEDYRGRRNSIVRPLLLCP